MTRIPKITMHLWFDKHAKEAAEFYVSIFPGSRIKSSNVIRDTPSGDCETVSFELCGQEFFAISAGPYFKLNEAFSIMVHCETQEEIDYYWQKLSAVPQSEQCGWLKDKYGVSWQITPTILQKYMADPKTAVKVTKAFLQMKKLDIAKIKQAAESD